MQKLAQNLTKEHISQIRILKKLVIKQIYNFIDLNYLVQRNYPGYLDLLMQQFDLLNQFL